MVPPNLEDLLLFLTLPVVAIICISANIFIRARGDRSIDLSLKAFGVTIHLQSSTERSRKHTCNATTEGEL